MSIPLKLIYYNKDGVPNALPSDKRNIDIIHGVNFRIILRHIHDQNINGIKSWISGYENKLSGYLKKKQISWKNNDPGKYCTNLNYIIDYIVQGINNLGIYDRIRWTNQVENISMNTLRKYPSLNCTRNFDNYKNKHLFFKKLMLDLCEDIELIKKGNNYIKDKKCPLILSRLQYRKETLMQFFHAFRNKSIFNLNHECSLDFIHKNLSNINCNEAEEQPNISITSEEETVSASSSAGGEEPRAEERITGTLDKNVLETEVLESSGSDDGLENPESVDPLLDDFTIRLPDNEDPPKLDTTYAAASLAGVSLFGTILYKYTPFGSWFNSRRGARNGSNRFPLDNDVYDAPLMNNFEYLQTGIPNGEYQVGYGSITDY
ncbi:unnamed protein product [Plasmodium vivax]|uniref:(malaria parasite P. vivax) hypothetical protein n=1 Tax=Plasmodium vivax TaxID=5855 RepID=A0A8S4H5S8_PLAVI|nr:unnamed protein product [Plasmodium vivax]